ncbi:hypothetical protein VE03_05882 [Pseudogymnoascus sp. 23342-1-I1]|nr:hypothetical protein VE03_05882 [Pseudogymnoascus sp. 23342-1-I1]
MVGFQDHDRLRQSGNSSSERGATTVQIESSPPRTGEKEYELRKSRPLKLNQFDSDGHRSKDSRAHRKRVRSQIPSAHADSMATTEDGRETSNTSMSEGHQPPPSNGGAFKQNKLSLFQHRNHVDSNPTVPNLPAQPATSGPIINEDSRAVTPHPIHPEGLEGRDVPRSRVSTLLEPIKPMGASNPIPRESSTVSAKPLYPAPKPASNLPPTPATNLSLMIETFGAVGETIGEKRAGKTTDEHPSNEEFEIISIADTNPIGDDCNKSDLDWLCTQDPEEPEYMTLIPYSLSSVKPTKVFIKPSKAEVQRVAQLRLNVRRLRHEIQDLKSLLHAKEKQIFAENEEALKRLREFAAEGHRRPNIHDLSLELVSRLFFASRSSRDECGPLNDEIGSLEDRLALEEMKLTQVENSLYESFGLPPMESGEDQGNSIAIQKLSVPQDPLRAESEHSLANHINKVEGEDDDSDDDAYSTDSFEKYRKNYHPLYIEYQEKHGTQDNLYERRADIMEDKARLEDQQQSRRRVGLTLLKVDQDFLDSLPEVIRLLDVEIDEYRVEIERLKAQCLEQGIIDEDDNYIDDDDEVSNDSGDSMSPPSPPPLPSLPSLPPLPPLPTSIPPKPPVPTQPPKIIIPTNAVTSLPTTARSTIVSNLGARVDNQSYQSRINPWLLDKLAASRTELALLATILSAMDAKPDVASLLDVLRMWNHDDAGTKPPQRLGKLDEATLNKLRRVTRGVVGDGFDRALIKSLFGLSLWDGGEYGGSDETAYLDDI